MWKKLLCIRSINIDLSITINHFFASKAKAEAAPAAVGMIAILFTKITKKELASRYLTQEQPVKNLDIILFINIFNDSLIGVN